MHETLYFISALYSDLYYIGQCYIIAHLINMHFVEGAKCTYIVKVFSHVSFGLRNMSLRHFPVGNLTSALNNWCLSFISQFVRAA